jgi:hypothetical protein
VSRQSGVAYVGISDDIIGISNGGAVGVVICAKQEVQNTAMISINGRFKTLLLLYVDFTQCLRKNFRMWLSSGG